MKILGISSNYHDASASIVVDGKVIASAAEERFTLQKHDPSFPHFSIDFCLKKANIKSDQLDLVVYHEDPINKITRTMSSSFKNFPNSLNSFLKSAKEAVKSGFWIKSEICKKLNISPNKVIYIPHHLSHAAHAFLTSEFESAAIITIDAVGEWNATCIFRAFKDGNSNYQIEPVDIIPFPHSLGLVYSAFTSFLGFKANDSECSTMALSAYGKLTYIDQIKKIIKFNQDNLYEIELSFFDFSDDTKLPLTNKFLELFGEPRNYKSEFSFSSFNDLNENIGAIDEQRFADIAASLQFVLEEAIIKIASKAKLITGENNLCYAGGVSLNCVANSKLVKSNLFEKIYIPPDPGDGGGSMGAALYGAMLYDQKNSAKNVIDPYLGDDLDLVNFKEMVENLNPKDWHRFSKINIPTLKKENFELLNFSNDHDLIEFIASNIADNKIIGWMQGRFENGPRALGNRSILCRADSIEVAKRLSTKIKLRASFRPYACSITEEEAPQAFEEKNFNLGRWMQTSFKINPNFKKHLRAACHSDLTTRAQVCLKSDNLKFYNLLLKIKEKMGFAALLNTSFNEKGYPIVSDPIHGLVMFARTELDILVINNFVIRKVK